jgi:hypothetical protein
MFVLIRWERRALAVPLAQVEGIAVDKPTRQAIEGLAVLGRSGLQAVSNADLEEGTACQLATCCSASPCHRRTLN